MKEDQFIDLIQKEIKLMREILSSLRQEEIFLLQQDQNSWNYLMQERFSMIQRISTLRKERKNCSLEPIRNPEEHPSEIILLIDQLVLLLDKTNEQNIKNQNLLSDSQHPVAIAKAFPYAHSLRPSAEQKTPLLTTLMDEPLL